MADQNQQSKSTFQFEGGNNLLSTTGGLIGKSGANNTGDQQQKTNSNISFGTPFGTANANIPVSSNEGNSNPTGTTNNMFGGLNTSKNIPTNAFTYKTTVNPFPPSGITTGNFGNDIFGSKQQADQKSDKPNSNLFGAGENKTIATGEGSNQTEKNPSNNILSSSSNQPFANFLIKPNNAPAGGSGITFASNTNEKPNNTISNPSNTQPFSFNQNSNGLETNKISSSTNILGIQTNQQTDTNQNTNLDRGFSFSVNKNTNLTDSNQNNSIDKPVESNNQTVKAPNFGFNQSNQSLSSNPGSNSLTNLTKPEDNTIKLANTGLFSNPLGQLQSKALEGTAKEEKEQKSVINLNTTGAFSFNKPSNEANPKNEIGTTESKTLFGKSDTTSSNLTANLGTKDANTGGDSSKPVFGVGPSKSETTAPKISFGIGAKTTESTNAGKPNEFGSTFKNETISTAPKKENEGDSKTQTNNAFLQPNAKKDSTSDNKQPTTQNPKDLFTSQQPKTGSLKVEQKGDSNKDESKYFYFNHTAKLIDPKDLPKISNSLDEVAINSMMKKSIEEVINHWKNELDNQVDRFDNCADKLKNFEFMFRKHFETICSLYELINNLKEDGNNTLRNLKDISLEEDQIIEQLNIMEKSLDQYLEIADNKQNLPVRAPQVESRDHIYFTATEIANTVEAIQKDIDEVNSKISEGNVMNKEENLNVLSYENPLLRESISMDKNEFTNILNSYYASLRSIQFMEQNLITKIMQAEGELTEIRREREREKY